MALGAARSQSIQANPSSRTLRNWQARMRSPGPTLLCWQPMNSTADIQDGARPVPEPLIDGRAKADSLEIALGQSPVSQTSRSLR